jgi:hypothetical protein
MAILILGRKLYTLAVGRELARLPAYLLAVLRSSTQKQVMPAGCEGLWE